MSEEYIVLIEHLRGELAEISYVMLAAANAISIQTGGRVSAVLIGHQAQKLGDDLACDRVLYVDHPTLADFNPEAYPTVIASILQEISPRLVFCGDTSIGAEVAGVLSARLKLPLISYCREVQASAAGLRFISQSCGGKIMVEGSVPEPAALVTMIPGAFKAEQGRDDRRKDFISLPAPDLSGLRVSLLGYIEPAAGDIDISKEPVLISVGRGIQNQDNIALAEELAEALGGTVCASRPVVDQGWLPTTRLVGKSGKRVSPRLYLALGISGATEHVESITGSELIVAVNTDPAAPIFSIAQYGAEVDLLDLLPALTDQVRTVKVS